MSSASAITLHDLTFEWPDGTVALDRVSGTFGTGRTGLIGRNGAGKSTLLRLIAGELTPTSGRIDTAGDVGYLPQSLTLRRDTTVAELLGIHGILAAMAAIESGDVDQRHFDAIGDDWDIESRADEALHQVGFSAAELFMRDRNALAQSAAQQRVTLAWRGSQHSLHGDADVAASLLFQLASNAIAHAPEGGRVLIAARRRGQAVRIEVRDNGPGIAVIHQQRIFEEFVQLQAGESERRGGYGLGLAIAERLARLLGTRIGLRSEPGRGSTFWFELPRMPVMERHPPQRTPASPAWREAG